jgi:hypothetical protein
MQLDIAWGGVYSSRLDAIRGWAEDTEQLSPSMRERLNASCSKICETFEIQNFVFSYKQFSILLFCCLECTESVNR